MFLWGRIGCDGMSVRGGFGWGGCNLVKRGGGVGFVCRGESGRCMQWSQFNRAHASIADQPFAELVALCSLE